MNIQLGRETDNRPGLGLRQGVAAVALSALCGSAWAQAAPAAGSPANRSASAQAGGSTAAARAPSKAASAARSQARKATAAAGAAAAATAAAMALSDADDDQRYAFSLTHLGDHACEFKRTLLVSPHPSHEGYVHVHFDRRVITAKPVLSSTGAIRLEDVRGQFLLLQIAFKSMLLDTRSGQRVADECVHARHLEARAAAAAAPAQPGLGISGEAGR